MILYIITALILLIFAIALIVDKYNPVIQFHFIVGLGFLYLFDQTDEEEGVLTIHQIMLGICLVSISYIKPYDQ